MPDPVDEPLIQSQTVPYYDEDGIVIYHGDCREVLPSLSDVDLIFTSPPYNLGDTSGGLGKDGFNTYDTHDDARMSEADYEAHQRAVLSACWATLSPTGAIFYNHKPVIRDRVVALPTRFNPDLPLRQIIVWYRQMGVNWSSNHFLPVHEWIMILAKPDWTLRDKTASHASDVWMIRPDMAENEHPCPFPLALPLKAIQATNATLILDPFMGSGTTLRAAADLGLRAIGIDVSERYCELAVHRLAQRSLFAECL
jgi:site-specific DNA-methyltransferase (adenine-specific)